MYHISVKSFFPVDASLVFVRRTANLRNSILALEQQVDREPESVEADDHSFKPSRKLMPRDVPRNPHAAIISSRTKCNRMSLGRSASS